MKKEIRFSFDDFCSAAIRKLSEENPELQNAKVEYIKVYGMEPEGRYDVFYESPDQVAFTVES